ncbi:MAG: Ig-like domain-containing protein, partial [Synechococcaceae cyanobacterium]|nr:Ig-like domain-containing protein [Synechococcaceae cyanobacterium]
MTSSRLTTSRTRTATTRVHYSLVANPAISLSSAESSTLQLAINGATNQVNALLSRLDRVSLLTGIYGTAGTSSSTFTNNLNALFTLLSGTGLGLKVEVRSAADMNGAAAAYAPSAPDGAPRVYLNRDLLSNGTTPEQITWLLLEQLGQALDSRLNGNLDAAGDEGKAFAQALTGRSLTEAEMASLGRDPAGGVVMINGTAVAVESEANQGPSLTTSATGASFTEAVGIGSQAAPVAVFSGTAVSVGGANEAWQTITGLGLSVAGLRDGANEVLWVDGTAIRLGAAGSGVTASNGLSWSVALSGDTATLSFSSGSGLNDSAAAALINAISYQNTNADTPTAGARTVTVTSLSDSGGAVGGGTGVSNPNITSTITVVAMNDAPLLGSLAGIDLVDTTAQDSFKASTGSLSASDPEGSSLTYGLEGGTALSATEAASFEGLSYNLYLAGNYGTLYLNSSTGAWRFQPKSDWQLNALSTSGSESFHLTVSDGSLTSSTPLLVAFSGSNEAPEQYVLVDDGAPVLSAEAQALWEQALTNASRYLSELLNRSDRDALLLQVFGNAGTDAAVFEANSQALISLMGGSGLQIDVDLRTSEELNGAAAAYAAIGHTGTERIYVNGELINDGVLSLELLTSALLEEYGHAIDQRLNKGTGGTSLDSPGDEGQLFAALVTGVTLTDAQRELIAAENDSGVLWIEGRDVVVEMAAGSLQLNNQQVFT